MSKVRICSEIGRLEGVILHPPGPEVENMTPLNAERALYSDILNLAVARKEYNQLECILQRVTQTYRVTDLLTDILKSEEIREKIIKKTCYNEGQSDLIDQFLAVAPDELARLLIQGVPLTRNSLTSFLSKESFSLRPLHNFFFTRDASIAVHDRVFTGKMASRVREREAMIMQAIFDYHPEFRVRTINPSEDEKLRDLITIEGGDLLVAREDILLIGIGARTSPQGVDFIISQMKERLPRFHVIVQELPREPESFIHLDMVFTLLDQDACMVYEPLILKPNRYETVHITVDNGNVKSIESVSSLTAALRTLGMDLKPSFCGGDRDPLNQEREQWHSGANFFAYAPGKIIGYNRNIHTLDSLNRNGFEIIRARDFLDGRTTPGENSKAVITIDGSELSRGGGGARCMTMPFRRAPL
ncbi:MAG: arginine deiminase family protein [Bacteroidota bacterium]